jgi:hypothetical protein
MNPEISLSASRSRDTGALRTLARWLGITLFVVGLALSVREGMKGGVDFNRFMYPAAQRFLHRQNIYIDSGDPLRYADAAAGRTEPILLGPGPYWPLGMALTSPFGLFPESLSRILWMAVCFAVMYGGFWLFLGAVAGDWAVEYRLLMLGALPWAVSIRNLAMVLNPAMLVLGGICLFLVGDLRAKKGLMALGALLIYIKLNLYPALFLYLLLRRRWKLAVVMTAAFLLGDLLVASWLGLPRTVAGFRLKTAVLTAPGTINYPSVPQFADLMRGHVRPAQIPPGLRTERDESGALELTHWTFLFSAFTTVSNAYRLSAICTLLSIAALILVSLRKRHALEDSAFRMNLFVSCLFLGMLLISHVRYDVAYLLPAIPILIQCYRRTRQWESAVNIAIVVLIAFLLRQTMLAAFYARVALPHGMEFLVAILCLLITAAFLLSVRTLSRWSVADSQENRVGETMEVRPAPASG